MRLPCLIGAEAWINPVRFLATGGALIGEDDKSIG